MKQLHYLLLTAGVVLAACAPAPHKAEAPASASAAKTVPENPFFGASTLPYQAPPFDKISDADYQPAIEEGMRQQLAEAEHIASDPAAPTFDNTLVALEKSGTLLRRVEAVFSAVTQANTNDILQNIQEIEAPKLAAHRDAIYLNAKLYARVKALYAQRESLGLDAESVRLIERYRRNFVRAGAELAAADQEAMRALNKELSVLGHSFRSKLLAATKAGALILDSANDLDGFSERDLAAAAEAAKNRKLEGKYVVALQNTTLQPAQVSLKNRATPVRLFHWEKYRLLTRAAPISAGRARSSPRLSAPGKPRAARPRT